MRLAQAALISLLVFAAGCGEDLPELPTTPSVDVSVPVVEVFEGTVTPGAVPFYSIRVQADRDVTFMLASVVSLDTGLPLDIPLTLGMGVPQGTNCGVTRSTTTAPGLQMHIHNGTPAGTYCVNLSGTSALPGPATFAIRIRQEPTPLPDPAPGTITFASQLALRGFSSRTFTSSRTGTVTVTLESLSQSGATVAVGVGLPPVGGTGCHISRLVEVAPGGGPHLSMPIEAGTFCVAVFDRGMLTGPASFQLRLDHP
jgi:hypothetical protein